MIENWFLQGLEDACRIELKLPVMDWWIESTNLLINNLYISTLLMKSARDCNLHVSEGAPKNLNIVNRRRRHK
jgi:hypothetical protein